MRSFLKTKIILMFLFGFQGALITVWGVHIPVISDKLQLNTSEIGFVLLTGGVGAIVASQLLGQFVDRFSSKLGALVGAAASGIVAFLPPLMPNYVTLLILMLFWGAAIGATDISMNAQAVELEKLSGERIFTFFHAFWSLGGAIGSFYAATMLGFSIAPWITFGIMGVIWLVVPVFTHSWLISETAHQKAANEARQDGNLEKQPTKTFIAVLLLGFMGGAGALIEGLGIDWSALHQTQDLGADAASAARAVFVFSMSMAIFRFFADRVVARKGRVFIIQYGSMLSMVGIFLATTITNPTLALIGWLFAGLGISAVVPQIFAYSTEVGSAEHSGRNMAKVFGITYAGLLAGPAIIGWVATLADLSQSLKIGMVLAVGIFIASKVVVRITKTESDAVNV